MNIKKEFVAGEKGNLGIYIKGILLETAVVALTVTLFALVMFFLESGYGYASVFATVSVASGCFVTALYCAEKIGSRGYLTGAAVGGITFAVITLISMLINTGGLTLNTLFRFIIIMLSAAVGGIIGVNRKQNRKYI